MVKDLVGQRFGKLTVIKQAGYTKVNKWGSRYALWLCKCDCGNDCTMDTGTLKKQGNHSCGCLGKEHLQDMCRKTNRLTARKCHSRNRTARKEIETMYISPIELIQSDIQMKTEEHIVKAVQRVGVNVDKEELIKALKYDRHQYEKGYADGKADAHQLRLNYQDGGMDD